VKIIFSIFFIILFIMAFHVDDETVKACEETTGWSAEKCRIELTR